MRRKKEAYLFVHKRRKWIGWLWFLFFFVISVSAVLIVNTAQNRQVKLDKQKVGILGLNSDLEGFSILHISDLKGAQLGENQSLIANALNKLTYEAVCLTGDMIGSDGNIQPFLQLLALLNKDVPILMIPGDCDPAPLIAAAHDSLSPLANYVLAAQKAGVTYLDAPYPVTIGKATLWFCPESMYTMDADALVISYQNQVDVLSADPSKETPDNAAALRMMEYRLDAAKRLQSAKLNMKSGDLHIALSHAPLTYQYVRTLWDWPGPSSTSLKSVSLVLSGHQNGGQWRIPGLGAIYVPELGFFPEDTLVQGMSKVSALTQYISPGLGSSSSYPLLPGRLFNPPTITLITLTGKPQ